ncbi:MAG: hypothetical protein RIR26_1410 [Pseudomonadota bacterium]|jgi:hypothetical protein
MDVYRYLQRNRNSAKSKRYVLALQKSRWVAENELKLIAKAVENALPDHFLIKLDDRDEGLKALSVKEVDVVVLHHSLAESESELVDMARQLKEVRERRKLKVIFITKNERELINAYREKMALYEELDDFVSIPMDPAELFRKIQRAGTIDARAAKRFTVDEKVRLHRLDTDEFVDSELLDLSLVGCGVSVHGDYIFRRGEQMRIQIPLMPFGIFHPQYGDFLKLSLRVRRLSIKGDNLGCSIEHLTALQNECLIQLLDEIARKQRLFRLTNRDKKGVQLNAK